MSASGLRKRYTCEYNEETNDYYNCRYSSWDNWVRWVVLVIIIVAAFLLFFLFSCITARRRRQMGFQPYRGTGWAAGRTPFGHSMPGNNAQPYYQPPPRPFYNNSNNPPPAYTPPPLSGYYGNNNDVELQQPQVAHGGFARSEGTNGGMGGQTVYEPPKGPPPGM